MPRLFLFGGDFQSYLMLRAMVGASCERFLHKRPRGQVNVYLGDAHGLSCDVTTLSG